MRLNTVLKVLGLSAAMAMPFALVGCDDDDETKPTDAAAKDGSIDATGDVAPKLDTLTPDSGSDVKPVDTNTVDALGDVLNAG